MTAKRIRGACLLAAAVVVVCGLGPARAAVFPRAAVSFAGFELSAEGTGAQFVNDSPSSAIHPQAEGTAGKAAVTFSTGPVGYALASPVWPGPTAGNAGTLAVFLGAPAAATAANDPVRVEARTGSGQPTSSLDQGNVQLAAKATDTEVEASSTVAGAGTAPVFTTGPQVVSSHATVAGSGAEADASSQVTDIDIAGVVHVDSVVASARVVHDGSKADAGGDTVVTGLKVAGQPASLDAAGLHIGASDQPLNAAASAAANQALRQAGITLGISEPVKVIDGDTASFTSGSLLVTQSGGGQLTTMAIGGARAQLAVGAAVAAPEPDPTPDPTVPSGPGGAGSGSTGGGSSSGGSGGSGALPAPDVSGGVGVPPVGGGPTAGTPSGIDAQPAASLLPAGPAGIPWLAVLLALLAGAAMARRLAAWLDAGRAAGVCLIESRDEAGGAP